MHHSTSKRDDLRNLADLVASCQGLKVVPWVDSSVGSSCKVVFDLRSDYVERFWLSILGPSATWFARYVASEFAIHPDGFPLDLMEVASRLGLGGSGSRRSLLVKAIARCGTFGLLKVVYRADREYVDRAGREYVYRAGREYDEVDISRGDLAFRQALPVLPPKYLKRLTDALQKEHEIFLRELSVSNR